ncbi:unnamed protein product [Chironomus riparius]|uniref:LITAF domain-containing protein n=1 Tax=Chironomus riparius TaxID=315576 RepID=A0A9P0N7P9_9DIPT|nr:unnamed protein product [Chironomus riparius]
MSTDNSLTQPQMGFVGAPTSNNPPYPPGNNLHYPAPDMPPLPVNNNPMPSTSTALYPPNHQYPQSAPYAPHVPIPPNVHTSQPTANTVIIQEQKLSSDPVTQYCPNCKEIITTNVKYKSGTRTHGAALFLCALDQDCCALLPYCCDAAKDAHHSCPKCKHYFGKYEPRL